MRLTSTHRVWTNAVASRLVRSHSWTGRAVSSVMARGLHVDVSVEVQEAVARGRPVVALESTIISHGMPYPRNLEVARAVEQVVRDGGAVPATVAVIHGIPRIGLSDEHLLLLAKNHDEVRKASTRDLAFACAKGLHAATTVASTMKLASLAGIRVFATGGIGGVHRGAELTMDVSADLIELSRTPVTVVCAGIKSILDIGKSLEVLETHGVPVIGYQTKAFPSFFTNSSGFSAPSTADSSHDVAAMMINNSVLHVPAGIVVAVPNPQPADEKLVTEAIREALIEADKEGIHGAAVTPFLLARIERLTGGKSLDANIALVKNNARVATEIACHYASMKSTGNPFAPTPVASTPSAVSTSAVTTPTEAVSCSSTQFPVNQNTAVPREQSDVIVVGGAVMDIIGKVSASLTRPHTSNPGSLTTSPGGVGRNVADAVARKGASVLLATAVGDDDRGRALAHHATSLGIDTSKFLIKNNDGLSTDDIKSGKTFSTASYCAIHDSNGDLNVGLADMSIFASIDQQYVESLRPQARQCHMLVADGNISAEAFAKVVQLSEETNKPLFFEPTSDFKCLLPFQARVFDKVDILKPNTSELIQMVNFALKNDLLRTGRATVSGILANIVSNRMVEQDSSQIELVDIRVLTSALYRVLTNGVPSTKRKGLITGQHILVSMGKRGVLWCGPMSNLSQEERIKLTRSKQLVPSATDHSMTLHLPAHIVDSSLLHDTNGAGDNFCAGVIQSMIADIAQHERDQTFSGMSTLPSMVNVQAGLDASRDWLLRFQSKPTN